jgi:hypothetical protein
MHDAAYLSGLIDVVDGVVFMPLILFETRASALYKQQMCITGCLLSSKFTVERNTAYIDILYELVACTYSQGGAAGQAGHADTEQQACILSGSTALALRLFAVCLQTVCLHLNIAEWHALIEGFNMFSCTDNWCHCPMLMFLLSLADDMWYCDYELPTTIDLTMLVRCRKQGNAAAAQ